MPPFAIRIRAMANKVNNFNFAGKLKQKLKLSAAIAAMAIAMTFAPSDANAQQVVPGVDAECPIVDGEAICEGDLAGGISSQPGDPAFDSLIIRNPDSPIAPPGFFAIGVTTTDRDVRMVLEDDVTIDVFDDLNIPNSAQGVIGIATNGFDFEIESAATITADGNGGPGLGIETSVMGGGSSIITNSGAINAFTSGESAIALQGRVTGVMGAMDIALNSIINTGNLTVSSNGVGEREDVTAGILAVSDQGEGRIEIVNQGDISVSSGANSFDTDFNGVAAGIVFNAFNLTDTGSASGGSGGSIVNQGNITAIGPQTHGIVGFGFDSVVNIENSGTISTQGIGSFGILGQGDGVIGGAGATITIENQSTGSINLSSPDGNATALFALVETEFGSANISNEASLIGTGDTLRGIGISSFGAPTGGQYSFLVFNEGLIDLDATRGFGITAFSTAEDDVVVNLVNQAAINLSETTDASSRGMSALLTGTDAAATTDGVGLVNLFNSGSITMGAGNAIFAAANLATVSNAGALSTTGDNSSGILIQPGPQPAPDASPGFPIQNQPYLDLNLLDGSSIRTEGDASHGVEIDTISGDLLDTTVEISAEGTNIQTAGEGSHGFLWGGITGNVTDSNVQLALVDGSITTTGAGSHGVFVDRFTGTFEALNQDLRTDGPLGPTGGDLIGFDNFNIETSGEGSSGFRFNEVGAGSTFIAQWTASSISTRGNNSPGIDIGGLTGANGSISVAMSELSVGTEGDDSAAFRIGSAFGLNSATSLVDDNSSYSTTGDRSDAFVFGLDPSLSFELSSSNIVIDDTSYATQGNNSRGLVFDLSGGSVAPEDVRLILTDLTISTQSQDSGGLHISEIDGVVLESDSPGAIADSRISPTIARNTITTLGNNSIGLFVGGMSSDLSANETSARYRVIVTENSISTSGDNSAALVFGDLPTIASDDRFNSRLAIGVNRVITTTGSNSDGVIIGANWGTAGASQDDDFETNGISSRYFFGEISSDISTTGTGSVGLRTASFLETLDITETGSITADTFAIFSENAGGVGTLNNAGLIFGDLRFGDEDSTLNNSGTIDGNIDLGAGTNAISINADGRLNSRDEILLGIGNAITVAGVIAPGDDGPIQVTNIGSDLIFETGSRFLVDVDGMATDPTSTGIFLSDRLEVNGSATINGGTVFVSSLTPEGDFDRSAQFRIIGASDSVTGTFDALNADLPFLDLELVYETNAVLIDATREGPVVPFQTIGLTPNQQAVGATFDALEMSAEGDLDTVVDQLIFATTPQALVAFDSSSGEIYATLVGQSQFDGFSQTRDMLARARHVASPGWGIWSSLSVSDSIIDGDGNGAKATRSDLGLSFGIDYTGESNEWMAGVAGGFGDGQLDVGGRRSEADYENWHIASYGRVGSGGRGFTANGALTFSNRNVDVTRAISINSFNRTATSGAETETLSIAGELRYGIDRGDAWSIGPIASVVHVSTDLQNVRESGAQSLNLRSTGSSDDQTLFGLGGFANWQKVNRAFDLSAQYIEGGSNGASATLAFEGGAQTPFTILAPEADNSGVLASASGQIKLSSGWTLGAHLDGFLGSDYEDVSGSVVIGWRF